VTQNAWATIEWRDESVVMLDQRRLPLEEIYQTYTDVEGVATGIRDMVIRGAPAIGIAAAMGMALAVRRASSGTDRDAEIERAHGLLAATRPTAVNLFWALDRMKRQWAQVRTLAPLAAADAMLLEAELVLEQDIAICKRIGEHGADLIPDGATVLTHCNAGALATGAWGTALSVIRGAVAQGKHIRVLADETRPYLQGARLTSWELHRDGIDVTVIADNAAGHFISRGEVDCVIVGSDRTVANGDVCNKIGTYTLGVLCAENNVPFYAAVPLSTIDLSLADGSLIPIEERPREEVACFTGTPIIPPGVKVRNPAFDVTPARMVTAIVTEVGVARAPYTTSLRALFPPV
jgi:methylthioribose-1-phosphate isomerase